MPKPKDIMHIGSDLYYIGEDNVLEIIPKNKNITRRCM